jgi:mannosyl-3-phosphoglycerate phosphatase
MNLLIFSDLDGTLLSHDSYSFEEANEALKHIKQQEIPLIMTTSKTFKETIEIQNKLGLLEPFIVENGGGIFFPRIYKNIEVCIGKPFENFKKICIGAKRAVILNFVERIRKKGFNIKLYSEFSIDELMHYTGLSQEEAIRSLDRHFSEPFILLDKNENKITQLDKMAREEGLKILKGGRFYHFVGINQDKGKAIQITKKSLEELFNKKFISIGIGDSSNDKDMLENVDIPILIRKHDGSYENIQIKGLLKSNLIGPAGFNEMILKILETKGDVNG